MAIFIIFHAGLRGGGGGIELILGVQHATTATARLNALHDTNAAVASNYFFKGGRREGDRKEGGLSSERLLRLKGRNSLSRESGIHCKHQIFTCVGSVHQRKGAKSDGQDNSRETAREK